MAVTWRDLLYLALAGELPPEERERLQYCWKKYHDLKRGLEPDLTAYMKKTVARYLLLNDIRYTAKVVVVQDKNTDLKEVF